MNTIFKTILISMLALLLIGCGGAPENDPAGPEPESAEVEPNAVDTNSENESEAAEVESIALLPLTILADGQIRNGRPPLPLAFETSGKLLTISVAVGDTVAAGDTIATLDDQSLQETLISTQLRVQSSQNSLLLSQGELERLKTWEPDASAVAIAEANIASAEANLQNAATQDAAAGSSLTSANVQIQQAQRELANAQEAYDNAFSEGREWETQYHEIVCEVIGGQQQCLGITYAQRIKQDREGSTARLQNAKEQLQIARANWTVQSAQNSGNSSVGVEAQLVAAQEDLVRAQKAPTDAELAAAELNVAQAQLALEQEQFALTQAENALAKSQIIAPWSGTVQSVDVSIGGMVAPGTPIVTLIDTAGLEFITTNLSERDLDQIKIGQEAVITLKSYPNEPITGQVKRIDLVASGTVGDAAIFPVIIEFATDGVTVRQGMTGRVEILNGGS